MKRNVLLALEIPCQFERDHFRLQNCRPITEEPIEGLRVTHRKYSGLKRLLFIIWEGNSMAYLNPVRRVLAVLLTSVLSKSRWRAINTRTLPARAHSALKKVQDRNVGSRSFLEPHQFFRNWPEVKRKRNWKSLICLNFRLFFPHRSLFTIAMPAFVRVRHLTVCVCRFKTGSQNTCLTPPGWV